MKNKMVQSYENKIVKKQDRLAKVQSELDYKIKLREKLNKEINDLASTTKSLNDDIDDLIGDLSNQGYDVDKYYKNDESEDV